MWGWSGGGGGGDTHIHLIYLIVLGTLHKNDYVEEVVFSAIFLLLITCIKGKNRLRKGGG